jgi:hypothetical protein
MRFLPSPRETLRKLIVIAVLVQVSRYPIRPLDPIRIIMPPASLIPDRQLTFSPELAKTIGLEEAVLLQALGNHLNGANDWAPLSLTTVQKTLSFWSLDHIATLIAKLVALGIIHQQPSQDPNIVLLSAAANNAADVQGSTASNALTTFYGHADWQPSDDLIELLVLNHGIPQSFINSAQASFVLSNSSEAETQFRQHILTRWRDTQRQEAKQTKAHAFEISTPAPFDRDWTPSQDAVEILAQADIDIVFAESVRAEFILYWSERGGPPKEVNSRFVEHVRRRWLKHTSQMHHSTEPTRIPRNWEPDTSVYETLRLAGIEQADAQALLPEFVMYWVDSNEVHTSWNSKFLQHVKRQCRSAGYGEQHGGETGRGGAGGSHRSKDRSLSDDLTDTSWAN